MALETLVRSCLYNWLGYGRVGGRIWFIGTEEGGAEIWKQKTTSLEASLRIRTTFSISTDFKTVWEKYYNIPLEQFNTPNVWRYMAAFLMYLDNEEVNTEKIREYVFCSKKLGSITSDHFICELLPLPKPKKEQIYPYGTIWEGVDIYYNEVLSKRFEIIKSSILQNDSIKLLVSYDINATNLLLKGLSNTITLVDKWEQKKDRVYSIYQIRVGSFRTIYLLVTPFFGNGQASYEGLNSAANRIKGLIG